jgi:tRNA pseudouridine38-40 synthase
MARYKVILAYDGTHFQGFQRQGPTRTVQAEVEKALRGLGWTGRAILSSGRTDSGVHAAGQVAAFDLEWAHSDEELTRAINANLPDDAVVLETHEERCDFHPRFDAMERRYRYRLYVRPVRDPLRERFAWRVWPAPNADRLEQAAQLLQGSHDFAAFGTPPKPGGSTTRFIYTAGWENEGDELRFNVRGNAFLYHMVRRMVFAQVQVGQDRLSLEGFEDAVRHARPLPPGLAPAHGLTLMEVRCAESRQEAERLMQTLL